MRAVTAIFEKTLVFRSFDPNEPPQPELTYHLVGTNERAYLQHRIAGGASSWSQVLPVSLDPALVAASAAQPSPATMTFTSDGTPTDTTALRTLDVAHGSCLLRVPGTTDSVEQRLSVGVEVLALIDCIYYCSTAPPIRCLNDFEPLRALSNNGLFPTATFAASISAGAEQGLLSDNLLMLPGAAALLREAAAASPAKLPAPTPPQPSAPLKASPTAGIGAPSFLLALLLCLLCVSTGAVATWVAMRSAAPSGQQFRATPRDLRLPRLESHDKFKAIGRDEAEEQMIRDSASPRDSVSPPKGRRSRQVAMELLEGTPTFDEALYTGPYSDQQANPTDVEMAKASRLQPSAAPRRTSSLLAGVGLGCAALALVSAAILSGGGGGGGDACPEAARYMPGTQLAPLQPSSHIFMDGFETDAAHEYTITLLRLPVPEGEQTHEIYYDAGSHTAFTTIVTSSRLIQVPFANDGKMADHVLEWTVGHPEHNPHPEDSGLHNIAPSTNWPGCLWIATETDDRIYLVDPSDGFAVKYAMHTPTTLPRSTDGVIHHVGGPHSVREAPDGSVWVALKGSNYDGPNYDDPAQAAYYKHMMDEHFLTEGEAVPDGWAVWHIFPDAYNATFAPARGGILYEAKESPTMTAVDGAGCVWTTQDRSDSILHVDTAGIATQITLPSMTIDGEEWSFSSGSGPGIATSPDGSVWLSNLAQRRPWLVRFQPGSTDPLIFKDLMPEGRQNPQLHTIHMAFSDTGGPLKNRNVMYVLTSSLLSPSSTEAVIVQEFDDDWAQTLDDGVVGHQEIVLPSKNSAAHRIAIAETTEPRSILVTGLLSNSIYQISGPNL